METISPEISQLLRLIMALTVVVGLMIGLSFFLKKLGLVTLPNIKQGDKKRLNILESIPLDARRRLVILQCDTKQYVVILGPNGETLLDSVVDSSIKQDQPSS